MALTDESGIKYVRHLSNPAREQLFDVEHQYTFGMLNFDDELVAAMLHVDTYTCPAPPHSACPLHSMRALFSPWRVYLCDRYV